jgi:hypothetical protein
MIEEGLALRIARAQPAVIELEAAVRGDQAQCVGIDGGKAIVKVGMRQDDALDELNPLLGPVEDSVDVGPEQIAWMPRLKAIDTAIGLLGIKAPDKQEVSGNLDFNHDLSPELQEVFNRIYEKGKASDSHRRASKL